VIENGECYTLKQLEVKGEDLVKKGFKGKEVGEKLQWLLQAAVCGKCENDKTKLLDFLKKGGTGECHQQTSG
jgi:tRNA nucleotidyltransferase (CCA-adding enzyme)